jgi:hypothetical protein
MVEYFGRAGATWIESRLQPFDFSTAPVNHLQGRASLFCLKTCTLSALGGRTTGVVAKQTMIGQWNSNSGDLPWHADLGNSKACLSISSIRSNHNRNDAWSHPAQNISTKWRRITEKENASRDDIAGSLSPWNTKGAFCPASFSLSSH